jgi:hypothetical protein
MENHTQDMIMATDHEAERKKLINWLRKKSKYADDLFKDPGYSAEYKSRFNIMDKNMVIYKPNDIDDELNIGYTDDIYGLDEKTDEEITVEQYVDYIPKEITQETIDNLMPCNHEQQQEIVEKLSRHNIVILPGSNHSNANFLFKNILNHVNKYIEPYHVPFLSPDPKQPYDGRHKTINFNLDKEEFYNFIYENSEK